MTNRPSVSSVYKYGHLIFTYYGAYTPVIEVDGVAKTISTIGSISDVTVLHVPSSVFASGSQLVFKLLDGVTVMHTRTVNIIKVCYPNYQTLVWLNEVGGLDCYTFHVLGQSEVQAEKETIYSLNGTQVISSKSDILYSYTTKIESESVRLWLSELISSPRVWRLDTQDLVEITDYSLPVVSSELAQINITFKNAKQKILQTL